MVRKHRKEKLLQGNKVKIIIKKSCLAVWDFFKCHLFQINISSIPQTDKNFMKYIGI